MTFKFGEHEAKVYELTGVDLKKNIRTWRFAALGDALFFHGKGSNQIVSVNMKGETISDFKAIADSGAVDYLAGNGRIVVFRLKDANKLAVYDGKTVTTGAEDVPGEMTGIAGSDDFLVVRGSAVRRVAIEGAASKVVKDIIKDYREIPDFKKVSMKPVYADENGFYLSTYIKRDEKDSKGVPTLVAFDWQGKELRRCEGVEELPRGWAVTANYVIHTGSKDAFRVFDRESGKILGDAEVNMRPFALYTLKGNDVIVFDDRADKIYRVDF